MRAADSDVFKTDSFENSDGMGSEGCKTCDYILGYTAALVDNNLFGASGAREVASRFVSDAKSFNRGQAAGDVTSIVIGGAEFTGGSTLASGAVSVTAGSGGASAEVSVPAALGGALIAAHGAVVGTNAANSLASGKGRMDEMATSSSGTSGKKTIKDQAQDLKTKKW
ncbi:hypothetical protein PN465_21210 [Nodularia spumigena CS-584]|nr:hypothetical protein [Nodularia spumigena CS-584]